MSNVKVRLDFRSNSLYIYSFTIRNLMATKPPPSIEDFGPETLEKIAYSAAAAVEGREPNDRNRLGYNVWIWLKERKGTLEEAIRAAGARTTLDDKQVLEIVKKGLAERGVKV